MTNTSSYCAYFARLCIDKHAPTGQKITLLHDTIYILTPPTPSKAEADQDARDFINSHGSVVSNTIFPRVFQQLPDETYIDTCYRAAEWFENLVREMNETDQIATHNRALNN